MKELTYYKHDVNEYLTGSIRMCSYEAQGVFAILKCIIWKRDGYIPDSVTDISRLAGIEQDVLARALKELKSRNIIVASAKGLCVKFLLSQLREMKGKQMALAEAGRIGMEHRWGKAEKPHLKVSHFAPGEEIRI